MMFRPSTGGLSWPSQQQQGKVASGAWQPARVVVRGDLHDSPRPVSRTKQSPRYENPNPEARGRPKGCADSWRREHAFRQKRNWEPNAEETTKRNREKGVLTLHARARADPSDVYSNLRPRNVKVSLETKRRASVQSRVSETS